MDACQRDSILDQSTDPSRDLKLDASLHRKLMELQEQPSIRDLLMESFAFRLKLDPFGNGFVACLSV